MIYDELTAKVEKLEARVQSLATELAATKRRIKEMELRVETLTMMVRQAKAIQSLIAALNRVLSNQNNLNHRMELLAASGESKAADFHQAGGREPEG